MCTKSQWRSSPGSLVFILFHAGGEKYGAGSRKQGRSDGLSYLACLYAKVHFLYAAVAVAVALPLLLPRAEIDIEFLTENGDLPLIKPGVDFLRLAVSQSVSLRPLRVAMFDVFLVPRCCSLSSWPEDNGWIYLSPPLSSALRFVPSARASNCLLKNEITISRV